jgi:hypothetical protein
MLRCVFFVEKRPIQALIFRFHHRIQVGTHAAVATVSGTGTLCPLFLSFQHFVDVYCTICTRVAAVSSLACLLFACIAVSGSKYFSKRK